MAQQGRARGRLARRYAMRVGVGAAVALVVLLGVVAMVGAVGAFDAGGFVIERAETGGVGQDEGEGQVEAGEEMPDERVVEETTALVVHVDGAVASPGLYELPDGSRVGDAVSAAGGLVDGADTSSLNLAERLADGTKVTVPLEGQDAPPPATEFTGQGDGLVNLNSATVEELDELPGVGEKTAQAIVDDREENGPFASPEDLMRVSGIGEKKFERLEAMVCV